MGHFVTVCKLLQPSICLIHRECAKCHVVLAQLGEETWGQRCRRAREASHLTIRATAKQLTAAGFDVSYATIGQRRC
jgi:hypothetical protein